MARIPEEVIEQVRQASDIVEVINNYLPLKKAGADYKALSPFNKEKTPSFFVSPSKQIFKDFSSGYGGGVFRFVELYENVDFPTAVRRLAEKAGIPIPEEALPEEERGFDRNQRERLFRVHVAATNWFKRLLLKDPAGEPGRAYLKSRQINSEIARRFDLGFAPDAWDAVINWGKQNDFDVELLESAGLVTRNENGRTYDRFRGRLIFPISDESERVVGFSGRLLDPDAKAAKYINSPETPIFNKSKLLYGLHKTKRAIADAGEAIVCEGQIDLIRCYVNGIENVVAPQGTAFTEQHGRLLKRFAGKVILCFDADSAGQRAASRSVDVLLPAGLEIRIAPIPAGEDPDSLLLSGRKDEFIERLSGALDFVGFLLEAACQRHDLTSPRGRGDAASEMAELLQKIGDPVQREQESLRVANRLQIPLASLQELLRTKQKPSSFRPPRDPEEHEAPIAEARIAEVAPVIRPLLSLLLSNPEIVPSVQARLQPAWTESIVGQEVLWRLIQAHSEDAWDNAEAYIQDSPPSEASLLSELLLEPIPLPSNLAPEAVALDITDKMQDSWRRRKMALLRQEIKAGGIPADVLLEKSKELSDLSRLVT